MKSNTIELTRSGCSMWTKCPTSSSISQRPFSGKYGMTFSAACPTPSPRRPGRGCRGTASAAREAHEGPLRAPRSEAAEPHRRVDLPAPTVVGLEPADGHQASQPVDRTAEGSSARDGAPARRSFPVGAARSPCGADGRASRRVSSAIIFDAFVLGDVGHPPGHGIPSMFTRCENRNGWASASCVISAPPLECAIDGHRTTGRHVIEDRQRVAHVGVPRVQLDVGAVAVATMRPSRRRASHRRPTSGRTRRTCGRSPCRRARAAAAGRPRRPIRAPRYRRRSGAGGTGGRVARRPDSRPRGLLTAPRDEGTTWRAGRAHRSARSIALR